MTGGVSRRPLIGLLIPAAVAVLFIALPLIGLLAHVDWSTLPAQLVSSDVLTSLRLSLECSVIAVAISLVIGIPLAYLLARTSLPGRRVLRGLVTLPLVLPPVVGGIALQTAFGTTTPIGTVLHNIFGIGLGSGFKPNLAMGGEPSFSGQLNSLWLYQNDIGAVVYRGIFESLARVRLPRLSFPSIGVAGLLATA